MKLARIAAETWFGVNENMPGGYRDTTECHEFRKRITASLEGHLEAVFKKYIRPTMKIQTVQDGRRKWFIAEAREAESWTGPFDTIDKALVCACAMDHFLHVHEGQPVYVASGRKLSKAEREEMLVDYEWEVETKGALKISLPESGLDK